MVNQWFKFYGGEYLSDPKMDRLTVQERSCWLTLLCMSSQSSGKIKYLSVESLLLKSGIKFNPYDTSEWDNALSVLQTFEKYKMIKIDKTGQVEILNWDKRQEHNLTVAERVAKSRAKKKNVTMNVTSVTTEENRIEENRIEENICNTVAIALTQKKFIKPSILEISEYMISLQYPDESEKFWNFYESKGWKVGKSPMVSWKSSVVNWSIGKIKPKTGGVIKI